MDQKSNPTVEQRLRLETVRRAVNGTFSQVLMLSCMIALTPPFVARAYYVFFCCVSLFVILLRWSIYRRYKDQTIIKFPWAIHLGLSTSFLWAIEISLAIHYFGVSSLIGLFHVYFVCGVLTNVMYSLSPTPKVQQLFVTALGIPVSMVIYFGDSTDFRYSGLILAMFSTHLILASRTHFSDLRSAYELEEALSIENKRLQEVVDSVPGFMILVSEKGKQLQSSQIDKEVLNSPELMSEIQEFKNSGVSKKIKEIEIEVESERHSFVVSFEKVQSIEGSMIIFGLPIDELKEMRHQLEVEKAKAAYASKLAGIGMMASGVAHEINNPLAIISMNAETLRAKLASSGVEQSVWDKKTRTITDTVNRIASIIRSLQQLSREDVLPQRTKVDLHQIIREVINVSSERMKQLGISLNYENEKSLLVEGHYVELGQVFLNLINNSVDAVKETSLKQIFIEVEETAEEYVLDIKDTGIGITPEVEKNLFQPFFTTKDIGSGTGLGLSISRSILLSNQGSISLVRPTNLTTFQVRVKKA